MILDPAGDKNDAFAQQPRINVKTAFAAGRLFDDDRNEAADNVRVIRGAHEESLLLSPPISAVRRKGSRGTSVAPRQADA